MKIAINSTDYTVALDAVRPLEVVRRLNEPTTCRMWLTLAAGGALITPARNARVTVTGDDGTVYFTGYLAVSPLPEYAGLGMTGAVYRLELQAISDEILLDTQLIAPTAGTTGETVGQVLTGLVTQTGSSTLVTSALTLATPVSQFVPEAGRSWSALAGQAATMGRAAYKALSGALTVAQVGTTVHRLTESNGANGSLALGSLTLTTAVARALANDVTVCGAEEPVAYVTEFFWGDGTTISFPLTEIPFFGPAAAEKIIYEQFNEAAINTSVWAFSDNGSYFSLTAPGLTMNGGSGIDGQSAMYWDEQVEAGGSQLLEAVGVQLAPGSAGIVAGLYSSTILQAANCVAGFMVTAATGTGAVSISPYVQGAVSGTSFITNAANQYTLRTRVHCLEAERVTQQYRVVGDSGLVSFGGGGVVAEGWVEMELVEYVDGVAGTPVRLFDGAVGYLPGAFTVVAASSVNLIGTMRAIYMKGLGTEWVSTVAPGALIGTASTTPVGAVADGAVCQMTRTGLLNFLRGTHRWLGRW